METFIKEFNFKNEDMHLCDDLIQYHFKVWNINLNFGLSVQMR